MDIIDSFYRDALTKLPNFFSFLECDFKEVFKKEGFFIQFDIKLFMDFNNKYGKSNGDLCLKLLSASILQSLSNERSYSCYRNGGDEFIIILPNYEEEKVNYIVKSINDKFNSYMKKHSLEEVDLNIVLQKYTNSVLCIEDFYKILYTNMFNQNKTLTNIDDFINNLIKDFVFKVKNTVNSYNNAYTLALTDDTTGMFNHRASQKYLSSLLNQCKENHKSFYLLFIDGDNLKKYNNICYDEGNKMIRALSNLIQNSLPKDCHIFRWLSGDEFIISIENDSLDYIFSMAETIRTNVEAKTKNWCYPITVSIGISKYPEDGLTIDQLIYNSEKALVAAKNSGKNTICFYNTNYERNP